MQGSVVTVERVIPASAETIFALLTDPTRHHDLDGSGTVMGTKQSSAKLGPGSTFGMRMRIGVPYSTSNTVVEYEENRRIAWQTGASGLVGRVAGGRIWRYELEPAESGTLVRESWDISQDKMRGILRMVAASNTRKAMEKTLARIEELTTS